MCLISDDQWSVSPNVLLISLINYLPSDIWHRPPPVFLLQHYIHHLHFISYLRPGCQISSSYNLIWRPYHWQDRCFFTKLSISGILIAPKSFNATLGFKVSQPQNFRVPFQVVMTCRSSSFNNFTPTLFLPTFSSKFPQEAGLLFCFLFSIL